MQKGLKRIFSTVITIVVVFLVYSYFFERNNFQIEKQVFDLDCKKTDFVHISDLHFTRWTPEKTMDRILKIIKDLNPSSVFITGDLISEKQGSAKAVSFVLKISVDYPVFVVFGNWDNYVLKKDISYFQKELEKAGAIILDDQTYELNGIDVLGIKDPFSSGNTKTDLAKAIKDSKQDCKILLVHSPDAIHEAEKNSIDLVLTGHTHGGQVYIPFLTNVIIPVNPGGEGYVKGVYSKGNTKMYVNRGIGTSSLPLRFLVPPEIALITVK